MPEEKLKKGMIRWVTSCFVLMGIVVGKGSNWVNGMAHNADAAIEQADILIDKLFKEESNG